jgi:membrane protein YdbS with pleckstrin-like domain
MVKSRVDSGVKSKKRETMTNTVFCNKCGQPVPVGSRFCNGCGATMAQTRADVAEAERDLFTIRPTMIFVYMWYALAIAIVIGAAVLMGILKSKEVISDDMPALYVIGGIGILAFIVPVYKHILRLREVYTLTNFKLEMRYGIIAKKIHNIPINKIQDVMVTSSVWQRFLNLGDIIIDSASDTGKIHLDDIHHPHRYAEQILGELRRWN